MDNTKEFNNDNNKYEFISDLVNIIDSFELPDTFNDKEQLELIETAYSLIIDFIEQEPMLYIQPYFHDYVVLEVSEILVEQLSQIIEYDIEDDVNRCVEYAINLFYKQVSPKRSYRKSFIRLNQSIENPIIHIKIKEKIEYLQNIPQPEQRTTEWYNFRYKYLTASSIWKAFISQSTRNQLIYDKCKPLNIEKYNHTTTDSPMHWGHKYEPVSVQIYEHLFNTNVSDFGCIPHKTIHYLAASPDGINTLETSERYGRMLEIKNIVNREIDGNPKMEYWIQMQMQMEVCNLNECDFLETRFKEYEDEKMFTTDSNTTDYSHDITKTKDGHQKGMMMQFMVNGQPYYEYAPLNIDITHMKRWEEDMMENHPNDVWIKNIYWRLYEISCVLVLRNKFWFNNAVPILNKLWETIETDRQHGYEHRSPNKRIKIDSVNAQESIHSSKCLIDLNTLDMDIEREQIENSIHTSNIVLNIKTEIM